MPIDEATLQAAVEQHSDDIRLEYEEANIYPNSDLFVAARNSFRAGAAFAAEQLSPAWVTAAEVDKPGWWWWRIGFTLFPVRVFHSETHGLFAGAGMRWMGAGRKIKNCDGLWTPAIVPTPPVSVEHTPDGPLTTTEKGVL